MQLPGINVKEERMAALCVHMQVRGEGGKEKGAHDFPVCKSLRTMSSMVCSHSQHKGEKNTVTAATQGRILSS